MVQEVDGEDDLGNVELNFALFEASSVALKMGEELPAGLVIDDEEEVGGGLEAVREGSRR
jgi:hypothetical protein